MVPWGLLNNRELRPGKDVHMTNRDHQLNIAADLDATQQWLRQCDEQTLLKRLRALLADDSRAEAELLSFIGEIDHRKLYRQRGFSSMFQ